MLHHIYFCPLIFVTAFPRREPAPNPIIQPLKASQGPITNQVKHCTIILRYRPHFKKQRSENSYTNAFNEKIMVIYPPPPNNGRMEKASQLGNVCPTVRSRKQRGGAFASSCRNSRLLRLKSNTHIEGGEGV